MEAKCRPGGWPFGLFKVATAFLCAAATRNPTKRWRAPSGTANWSYQLPGPWDMLNHRGDWFPLSWWQHLFSRTHRGDSAAERDPPDAQTRIAAEEAKNYGGLRTPCSVLQSPRRLVRAVFPRASNSTTAECYAGPGAWIVDTGRKVLSNAECRSWQLPASHAV
ncbi:hypothetical protein VTN96DRAFT_353 [Rasamsonia emersonii]